MKSKPCKLCESPWHTKAFCPLNRKPIKKAGKHTNKDRYQNKKFRESRINFEGYLVCDECGSWFGSDADHKKKKSLAPQDRYNDEKKQILCRPCHIKKDSGHKRVYF